MTDGVFGKCCGSRIPETITFQVLFCNLADGAHALFAGVFEIVESGFERAAA